MAAAFRGADPPLDEFLFSEPYRFDFFQAVRLLERLDPARSPVGREGSREVARFKAHNSLAFPASEIHHLDPPSEDGRAPEMTVAFFGLTGPLGVLPHAYTEFFLALEREWRTREDRRDDDPREPPERGFFDIFNHRLISLFFRAWEKYRPAVGYERGEADRFTEYLFHLIGLGLRPLRDRHAFPDAGLPFHGGVLAQRHRPAIMLENLLIEYFGKPVEVVQFVGRWLRLAPDDCSTLSADGPHNALGRSLVAGERVWDEQGSFRLRVGPLTFREFRKFLPDGAKFLPMVQMTRLFVDAELNFDVQLVLKAEEVPPCRLTSKPAKGIPLGRFSWLTSRTPDRDMDEAIFNAPA